MQRRAREPRRGLGVERLHLRARELRHVALDALAVLALQVGEVAIMTPSSCQTVAKRCQSPASRHTAQFSTSSRTARRSAMASSIAVLLARVAGASRVRDHRQRIPHRTDDPPAMLASRDAARAFMPYPDSPVPHAPGG